MMSAFFYIKHTLNWLFQKICKFCGIQIYLIFFKVWPIKTFQLYVLPKYKASDFNKKRHDFLYSFLFELMTLEIEYSPLQKIS